MGVDLCVGLAVRQGPGTSAGEAVKVLHDGSALGGIGQGGIGGGDEAQRGVDATPIAQDAAALLQGDGVVRIKDGLGVDLLGGKGRGCIGGQHEFDGDFFALDARLFQRAVELVLRDAAAC